MNGLNVNNAPSAFLVIPHYLLAAFSFLFASVLVLLSTDDFLGHYFNPALLSIVHISVLGWATMIIMGALYQFAPVIFQTSLYSELTGYLTMVLLASGTLGLVWSFWNFSVGLPMQFSSVLICLALLLFTFNIAITAIKSKQRGIEADFIVTSLFWLLATAIMGVLMAFNFRYVFLKESHLFYLKIHAHAGMAGWFLMLIIGVASKLLPMFMLSHKPRREILKYTYYLLNIGLIGLMVDWFFTEGSYIWIWSILISSGILSFLIFVFICYHNRLRKNLEQEIKISLFAVILMLLPLVTGIYLSFQDSGENSFMLKTIILYGFSIFAGFITTLILGQTFKTLPFIVWLFKYKKHIGKFKTPLPKELYSETMIRFQTLFYISALFCFASGIIFSDEGIIKAGGILLVLTAIVYLLNVMKVIFHQTVLK
jgi:hypothetical protein